VWPEYGCFDRLGPRSGPAEEKNNPPLGENVKKIRELLDEKGTQVWSIPPTKSVYDALALMAEKNVGALLVMDQDQLLGVISERDYTRGVVLQGRTAKDTQVNEIMTSRPVCVGPDQTIEDAMALMTDKRVRHLPVVEGNRVVGLVSIGDAVKATISEQKFIIKQLEQYISG
jgi:CBS domain-containing protein